MKKLIYEEESRELWSVGDYTVQLVLPNWGTMGVYAQAWSVTNARWELLWHLEEPAIIRALREKTDIAEARAADRRALLAMAEKILKPVFGE